MLNFITHKDDAKKAVQNFEKAKRLYERAVESIKQSALSLFSKRENVLDEAVNLYNKILLIEGVPSDFVKQIETQLANQQIKRMSFSDDHTIHYDIPNEEHSEAWKYMFGAAGVGSGAAVAGRSILTALATTFGTASTGVAISSLSGVAARDAVLAWIIGGTVAAGGGVMALGRTILGLMGPIGWGITGIYVVGGGLTLRSKNDKIIAEHQKATKEYQHHGDLLNNKVSEVKALSNETEDNLRILKQYNKTVYPMAFSSFSDREKLEFGKMISDILLSLRHLNKAVI